jgi:uncharacterized damage-inducible protein DinB
MMREILQQYVMYNKWANEKVIEVIKNLPDELINNTVDSSFNSLRLTVLHLWDAEYIWWQRLNLAENIVSPAKDIAQPIDIIFTEWKRQSLLWQDWVMKAREANLSYVFAYVNSNKEQYKQPVYQVLLHLFNHGTYHRGQIVTLLHQLGVREKPHTDFILWSRSKK